MRLASTRTQPFVLVRVLADFRDEDCDADLAQDVDARLDPSIDCHLHHGNEYAS